MKRPWEGEGGCQPHPTQTTNLKPPAWPAQQE